MKRIRVICGVVFLVRLELSSFSPFSPKLHSMGFKFPQECFLNFDVFKKHMLSNIRQLLAREGCVGHGYPLAKSNGGLVPITKTL
jgi:hypothetical protein